MTRAQFDLKDPADLAAFLDLAADADVIIESFRPGVVARLGIGYDDVKAGNPGIVYCSTSGYGQDGPVAVGRPRPQLPRRHRLPRHDPAARRRWTADSRSDGRRQRGRRHARGDRDPRRARAARHHRRGCVPRRVGGRRRARAHGAARRRVPRHRRHAAQRPHWPVRVLRHVSSGRRRLARRRRHRAPLLGEPVPAAGSRALGRPADRRRCRTRSAPISVRCSRRGRATSGPPCSPPPTRVCRRCSRVADVPGRPVWSTPRIQTTGRSGKWHRRSRGPFDDGRDPRRRGQAHRRGAVRGGRRVPRGAELHLDHVLVGRERQPVVLGRRRGRRRSPTGRSRRRRCSRCGSARTTGRRGGRRRVSRCRCTST